MPEFVNEFSVRVLEPALSFLRTIRFAVTDVEASEQIRRFQDWIVDVQLPSLGAAHTGEALLVAGADCKSHGVIDDVLAAADRRWVLQAREAVSQAVWWSCPHAAVSSQGVVAWLSARLEVAGGVIVEEPGRVFVADDSAEHSILIERMLQPIFLQVPRNGHAERRALVSLLRQISRAVSYDHHDRWSDAQGSVRLYASHFLCMSCIAAVAQFCRRLPRAEVQVEFDNAWSRWAERPFPSQAVLPGGARNPGASVFIVGSAA